MRGWPKLGDIERPWVKLGDIKRIDCQAKFKNWVHIGDIRDLTILGRQRDDDGQNKLFLNQPQNHKI